MMKKLIACAILMTLGGASLQSLLVGKRQTEMKSACYESGPRVGEPAWQEPSDVEEALWLNQLNDDRNACSPPSAPP